jgi:hypothetical protein
MPRPLHEIARDIAATWPTPSPHAKAYLKAMHYLIGIEDYFAAGNARRIVRCFLLYSKEWQGADADRIKTELREVSEGASVIPSRHVRSGNITAPVVCELCKVPITDKFVHGNSVWGVNARMCPSCHYYIGIGFEKGDGALYHLEPDGSWQHLHGTPPPCTEGMTVSSPITGKIPMLARAKRGRLVRLLAPGLRRLLKVMRRLTGAIGGQREAA